MYRLIAVLLVCALPGSALAQTAASPPAPEPRPLVNEDTRFSSLFTKVPPAFKHLHTSESLWVLATTGMTAGLIANSDGALTRYAANSVRFEHNLTLGHALGDIYFQGSFALGTYLVGYKAGKPKLMLVGADLVRAQLMGGFITDVTKVIIQRQRPNGANYSFPSGHTTSAFASAAVLQRHYGLKAGIPAYAIGVYVATSRMADNRHFPSDLVMGAAIGIVSGRAVTVGRGATRLAIAPMPVPGGAGVSVSVGGSN